MQLERAVQRRQRRKSLDWVKRGYPGAFEGSLHHRGEERRKLVVKAASRGRGQPTRRSRTLNTIQSWRRQKPNSWKVLARKGSNRSVSRRTLVADLYGTGPVLRFGILVSHATMKSNQRDRIRMLCYKLKTSTHPNPRPNDTASTVPQLTSQAYRSLSPHQILHLRRSKTWK